MRESGPEKGLFSTFRGTIAIISWTLINTRVGFLRLLREVSRAEKPGTGVLVGMWWLATATVS